MLVHFIGGPAHGRSEAIKDPHPVYRMAELRRLAIYRAFDVEDAFPSPAVVPFTEHEYKITRRTARYAVAEWQAPPVDVRFEVRLEIDPWDQAASEAMRKLFLERRNEPKHDVRCIGAHVASSMEATLELVTRVEGPDDPTAIQLAAEKVQHYIDAELPPCKQHIRSAGSATA